MSAEKLLNELAEQGWLPDSVLKRVRQKVTGKAIDAESVARFLVDKGHLTRGQADQLLDAISEEPLVEPLPDTDVEEEPMADLADPFSDPADEPARVEEATDPEPKSKKKKKEKRRKKHKKNQNEWDSPLMLIGGGALILLLMCGAGVYFLLLRGSGDDLLRVAQESFDDGSYSQAIAQYEDFLEKFPSHDGGSLARVNLGLARIRQALEVSRDYEMALERSTTEIPAMMLTDEVEYAQSDLSALLPRIASGLVDRADAAEELEAINKYVDLTNKALDFNLNTKYVPSQKRNKSELEQVQEILTRIGRRQAALEALKQTLETMQGAMASGDIRPAYEAHAALVKGHPELANKPELTEAIAAAVVAEQGGVRFVDEPIAAETAEADSPVEAVVATADQRRTGSAPTDGFVVFSFQGVLYGFGAADGQLLWRRSVGDGLDNITAVLTETGCLAVDSRRRELVALDGRTGELRWRTPLDDDLVQPKLLGDRVLVPSQSGRLHVVNADTGRRDGYLQFAQPLVSAPAIAEESGKVYLIGEHSSVYTLSADDLSCLGVYYLGHAKGSVAAPPATVLGRVLVAENDGRATSTLHVLATDDQGVIASETDSIKLKGLSPGEAVIFGRRLAALTDTGQITIFETSPEDVSAELTEIAARRPPRRSPTQRYAALVDRHLWVAGRGLAKYSIVPAGNRLPVSEVRDPFRDDVFTSPLIARDGVLLHARRRRGKPGLTVSATDTQTGQAYWETDVAVPPAGAPSASTGSPTLIQTTATGRVYQTPVNVSGGVLTPTSQVPAPAEVLLSDASVSEGSHQLMSAAGSEWLLRVANGCDADWSRLPDGLACEPTEFSGGWLATLRVGQVLYVSGDPAAPLAAPFQPEIAAGVPRPWYAAGTGMARGEPIAVVTNGESLYTLQLFPGEPPRLEVISEVAAESPLATRVAVTNGIAVAGRLDGGLALYDAESLDAIGATPAGAPNAWGPYSTGDRVLVATVDRELRCYDFTDGGSGEVAAVWTQTLPVDGLLDAPLANGASVAIATRAGLLLTVSLEDGAMDAVDLREPVATAPATAGDRLALATPDGAVLFVDPWP